ncbi:glycoside hydrolase family 3 C-terminal domain-containing protein [Clostridium sp. D5]|uniref:glycoside hydrolase family 3 C-terminal domain-containing protein n=1 Tax=Clostridium sp. D5 TaxID=556261 RepID=UPI0001FC8497|nr:glycoside hydrolase family 3 C-terminal domain-containing protein [Clostridium sp. D5]EGB91524.1 thermostable beta-glucosidase B (Gentiobiase) [Clostridium sp. D5]
MTGRLESQLQNLTMEEKIELLSGADFWTTKKNERIGLSAFMMTDGPNGLRKQTVTSDHLGMNASMPATCFPMGCALACSWDPGLAEQIGEALAGECREAEVDILLGPGVNLKRSPLGGRNFEYFSEDPYLTAQMAIGYINGVQKNGVGVSLKHFAANNQETERLVSDSIVDERTLRELYLACFESVVKETDPWTVMCSYNKLNGIYTSEHEWLLKKILKDEWQYDGVVISDWGAVNEKSDSVKNGLDLEMPGNRGSSDQLLLEAYKAGTVSTEAVDEAAARVLRLGDRILQARAAKARKKRSAAERKEWPEHHELARKAAADCMVLLKNEGSVLPLIPGEKTAVFGELACDVRFQGSGSSKVNPYHVESPLEEMKKYNPSLLYAKGYELGGSTEDREEELLREAELAASICEKAVVFAGYPERAEYEGEDKVSLSLPENQLTLIRRLSSIHPAVIVVLCNGAPVEMPFRKDAEGILEMYLAGEAAGGAAADILYGAVNPSGRLAETFPKKLEDTPSWLNFPGMQKKTHYAEGLFVGYRYYDKKTIEPLYPFGYGLSYTDFAYSNLSVKAARDTAEVQLEIQNTGRLAGAEVVQIYVRKQGTEIPRPEKELKGFQKVHLAPGEKKKLTFTLPREAFRYYDTDLRKWQVEPGEYEIQAASSSRDIHLRSRITLEGDKRPETIYDKNSTLAEISKNPEGKATLEKWMTHCARQGYPIFTEEPEFIQNAYETTPLRWLIMLSGGCFTEEMMQDILKKSNRQS